MPTSHSPVDQHSLYGGPLHGLERHLDHPHLGALLEHRRLSRRSRWWTALVKRREGAVAASAPDTVAVRVRPLIRDEAAARASTGASAPA
jgi:hypothetical protein